MSISGLRKTGETYAKRYARLTMLSVAVAAVLTAVVGAAGTPGRLAVLPGRLSVPPRVAVFIQFFGLCFAVGLLGRVLYQNLEKLQALFAEWVGDPLRERWGRLARRTQAVIFGLCCTLVSGSLTAAGVVYYGLPAPLVAGAMLATWPAATYWLLGRRPAVASAVDRRVVRLRYATLRQLETRTIAALIGFLVAAAVGSGLWIVGVEPRWATVVAVLVWVVSTVVSYNRYASTLETRSDLTLLDHRSRDDGTIELVVRNDSLEPIALTRSTITDTRTHRYHLTDSIQLSPASRATLRLPSSFAVSPTDAERTLPRGYTLDRSQPTPIVYSRSGIAFELRRESTDEQAFDEPTPAYTTSSTAIGGGTHSHES